MMFRSKSVSLSWNKNVHFKINEIRAFDSFALQSLKIKVYEDRHSFVYIKKRKGPRTNAWDIPALMILENLKF